MAEPNPDPGSVNPWPTYSKICPSCRQPGLLPPILCTAKTSAAITNWGRHGQPCIECKGYLWLNPPTPLSRIPDTVQQRTNLVRQIADVPVTEALIVPLVAKTSRYGRGSRHGGSMSSSSSVPVAASSVPIQRVYARPLDPSYAKPLAQSRHSHIFSQSRRLEAEGRAKELYYVSLYSRTPQSGPAVAVQRFKLINDKSGYFIPNTCSAIVNASAASTTPNLISVLDIDFTWTNQDLRLPITVTSTSCVLLRTCDLNDSDCLELDAEIALLLSTQTEAPTPVGVRAVRVSNALTAHSGVSVLSEPSLAPSLNRKAKFPKTYASQMEPGLLAMAQVLRDGPALKNAFEEEFPGCEFVVKTVYKHLKYYRDGMKLLGKYVRCGNTQGGKWSAFIAEVDKKRKMKTRPITIDLTTTEPTLRAFSPIDVDADSGPSNTIIYDDTLASKNIRRKMALYDYETGFCRDYRSPNTPDIQLMVFDNSVQGTKFTVHLASFYPVGATDVEPTAIAIKKFALRDDWWKGQWSSLSTAIWNEGARAATCSMMFQDFMLRASAHEILLPGPVLEGDNHPEWLGQPWHFGIPFSVQTLNLQQSLQHEIFDVLSAFSHFTYQCTNHKSVYVDFQGLVTAEGEYRVLDSLTHVAPPVDFSDNTRQYVEYDDEDEVPQPYSVNDADHFLGSQGEAGLKKFCDFHNCNAICGRLSLNPIPLVFPNA
ncbi:hypothetical protein C8F04DRAFT_1318642 [Mycena alexandri]|uniref:Alpha-type protein kinase domain-containing protein n=1 Tax=Mycena alexandri TaxID=1745969 RepID=A0AAD6S4C3_9AGAR|nr:hypothetical protein C8F04DRAFT_1318642 [Mycena alexandri]